jgi:DNA primase
VEGYTDVLMAHQMGVGQVVATLGTALNARHVRNLRRLVPRVVLVFDADAGGNTGVDRALEIFVSQDVELAVATLPAGMDPCDLLVAHGAEPFRQALASAVDALEFKLNQVLAGGDGKGSPQSVEERRQAVEALLKIIALAPETTDQAGAVKRELMIGRIARRLSLNEQTLWARLRELRSKTPASRERQRPEQEPEEEPKAGPAPAIETQLLQVLLAQPDLVPLADQVVQPADITHPGLRRLLEGMYALVAQGEPVDIDRLRARIDHPRLMDTALHLQDVGRANSDRTACLQQILAEFRKRRVEPEKQRIQNQLQSADHTEAVELLRQLQQRADFSL